jgi:AcrR family transcriptional regulator
LEGAATVSRVVAIAGVGRNSFYECFDDFEHALETVREKEARRVTRALALQLNASDFTERLSGLCWAWIRAIVGEPEAALVALEARATETSAPLFSVFAAALAECAGVRGETTGFLPGSSVALGAAAAVLSARQLLLGRPDAASGVRVREEGKVASKRNRLGWDEPKPRSKEEERALTESLIAVISRLVR